MSGCSASSRPVWTVCRRTGCTMLTNTSARCSIASSAAVSESGAKMSGSICAFQSSSAYRISRRIGCRGGSRWLLLRQMPLTVPLSPTLMTNEVSLGKNYTFQTHHHKQTLPGQGPGGKLPYFVLTNVSRHVFYRAPGLRGFVSEPLAHADRSGFWVCFVSLLTEAVGIPVGDPPR